ncbi:IS30 family transposase [Capnocytophaga gingivalis]
MNLQGALVKEKTEFGHWKIDLIVKAGNKGAILTMVEISKFSDFKRVGKKLDLQFFFAYPYCSCERGLSEHTNGLVRRYIPKETDFKDVSEQDIKIYQYKINDRPRKVLSFKKNKDLFYQKES